MKKILIFTANEGHLSLAQASQQVLQSAGFLTHIVDIITSKGLKFYTPFYRYFPFLFKLPYKISEAETIQKGFNLLAQKLLTKEIKKEIKTYQPDLIITTHFAYIPSLAHFLDYQKISIPFINLVANPWTIHPLEFTRQANINFSYDQKAASIGQQYKIPPEKIMPLGWLIRDKFYQQQPLVKIRKSLGFKKDIFTLLICGGSEGTNMILKIIPGLLMTKKPLQVIIVCGTNKTLFQAMMAFKKIVQRTNQSKVNPLKKICRHLTLKIFQFTNQLDQLIAVADLVAGKAGPNLMFETVALKKPFFALCHISGQEDDNLALIRKKGLGLVEENPFKAITLLYKIINQPQVLNRFQKSILKERLNNKIAPDNLLKTVNQLIYGKGSTKKTEF